MKWFETEELNKFLGVVRKYMQMRGALSQKELAEMTETSVSTISRLLNQKVETLDQQLIAKIVAVLDIPLHEIIDFVAEDATDKFKKLVRFYKDEEEPEAKKAKDDEGDPPPAPTGDKVQSPQDPLEEAFSSLGTAQKSVKATVRIGNKTRTIPFEASREDDQMTIKDKLSQLSPRQKAYISDFLNLDQEGRDLCVDLGNSLFRYFKQKGVTF
jgi:transcriptional regulator with XRE-family HTH domain